MRHIVLCFALVFAAASPALSQELPPMSEEQKAELFDDAFQKGLEAIRDKNFALGVRAFTICTQLYPERPTAYYNLACIHSLQNNKDAAFAALEEALKKGFASFEHMTRDSDLENIRKDARFATLVETWRKKLEAQVDGLYIAPEKAAKGMPLLVFLHGRGQTPEQLAEALAPVTKALGVGLLLPKGDVQEGRGFSWGQGGETVVRTLLEKTVAEHGLDAKRVILGGWSLGGYEAFDIALSNPGPYAGLLNFGPFYNGEVMNEKAAAAAKAGLRVFMVSGTGDPLLERARDARDALAEAGAAVILRRFDGGHQLPPNMDEVCREAFDFLLKGSSPERGAPRSF